MLFMMRIVIDFELYLCSHLKLILITFSLPCYEDSKQSNSVSKSGVREKLEFLNPISHFITCTQLTQYKYEKGNKYKLKSRHNPTVGERRNEERDWALASHHKHSDAPRCQAKRRQKKAL